MKKKISLIGAGQIGGTLAHLVSIKELADVVLFDVAEGIAKGKALDIAQSTSVSGSNISLIGTNNYEDTKNSDVIIITAGIPRKPGMNREDLLSINIKIISDNPIDLLECVDMAIVTSGTISLQATFMNTPCIVCYKLSKISGYISKILVKVPYISMTNIIGDEIILPELIQSQVNPENIKSEIVDFIDNKEYLRVVKNKLKKVTETFLTKTNSIKNKLEVLYTEKTKIESLKNELVADVKKSEADLRQTKADVKKSEAELKIAIVDLESTKIYAPIDGVIANRIAEPGIYVEDGWPLMAIVPIHDIWIIANYK